VFRTIACFLQVSSKLITNWVNNWATWADFCNKQTLAECSGKVPRAAGPWPPPARATAPSADRRELRSRVHGSCGRALCARPDIARCPEGSLGNSRERRENRNRIYIKCCKNHITEIVGYINVTISNININLTVLSFHKTIQKIFQPELNKSRDQGRR